MGRIQEGKTEIPLLFKGWNRTSTCFCIFLFTSNFQGDSTKDRTWFSQGLHEITFTKCQVWWEWHSVHLLGVSLRMFILAQALRFKMKNQIAFYFYPYPVSRIWPNTNRHKETRHRLYHANVYLVSGMSKQPEEEKMQQEYKRKKNLNLDEPESLNF